MRSKVLKIFKLSFRQVIASGAQDSSFGIFGGSEEVFNILTECKKVDHTLRGAILPKKKRKDKGLNTKKGQAKKPVARGSKKGKGKPDKRNNKKAGTGAKASDNKS